MAKQEAPEKQSKKPSVGGTVFLILFLLLIAALGYLYYSVVKAPLDLDDPRQMVASDPMPAQERFSFFPADGTVQIKMDAADLWSLIFAQAGSDFLEKLNGELASYDLSLSGCAIRMDEEGLRLDLELFFRDIRLVAKIPCSLEVSGRQFTLMPTAVKLGAISLPVENLLSSLKLEYECSLPVISEVTQLSFVPDALLLTGPMEPDIRNLVPLDERLYQTAVFSESLQPLVNVLKNDTDFSALMSHLEQNPGNVDALYRELLVMAGHEVSREYLNSRFGLTERFFPEIDFSNLIREQNALTGELDVRTRNLEQFFTELVGRYNNKEFRLSDGVFLINRKPFHAAEFGAGKYDALFEKLDPDSFFLILVDAEDGFIRKTSSFYRMADENQQFTQEVDYNKTYILGCVFRGVDGDPFLLYETEITTDTGYVRKVTLRPLTEEAVAALQEPGKFGVWTG